MVIPPPKVLADLSAVFGQVNRLPTVDSSTRSSKKLLKQEQKASELASYE